MSTEWHARARALRDSGMTYSEVGQVLGRTVGAVWKALHPERTRELNASDRDKRRGQRRAADRARYWREKYGGGS